MSNKNKTLYNYIVNTFGLSKDMVLEYAKSRIDDLFEKHIKQKLDSNYVEQLILNRVTEIVKNGFPIKGSFGMYYDRQAFDHYLKTTIRSVILEKMNDDYKIEVRAVHLDAKLWPRR